MEDKKASGFIEQSHTADWAVRIWAPDYFELLREAARGMYYLMDARFSSLPIVPTAFSLTGDDRESLLVQFLNELLFFGETKGLGLDLFNFTLKENLLGVNSVSMPLQHIKKEIKAVTYHNFAILEAEDRLETTVVFDV